MWHERLQKVPSVTPSAIWEELPPQWSGNAFSREHDRRVHENRPHGAAELRSHGAVTARPSDWPGVTPGRPEREKGRGHESLLCHRSHFHAPSHVQAPRERGGRTDAAATGCSHQLDLSVTPMLRSLRGNGFVTSPSATPTTSTRCRRRVSRFAMLMVAARSASHSPLLIG
jgi:hypothetical protein